jgi:ribosomal protein L37AE/L43A
MIPKDRLHKDALYKERREKTKAAQKERARLKEIELKEKAAKKGTHKRWAYGAVSKFAQRVEAEKGKRVNCLKCDRPFMGRINVRICDTCKGKEWYNVGLAYTDMEMTSLY